MELQLRVAELPRLVQPNHSLAFWQLVERQGPGAAVNSLAWHDEGSVPWLVRCGTTDVTSMEQASAVVEVNMGRQGRLVIPAALRRSLSLSEGDTLVARQVEGRLVLEKPEAIKQRLRARFSRVPAERQLVDELLAERRQEALGEGA